MKKLQKHQAEYDEKYFEYNSRTQFEKIRHITLHVMKLCGKLATYCEEKEHNKNSSLEKITNEIVPDLLAFSLQLSNILNLDTKKVYFKRLEDNIERLSKSLNIN